MQSSFMQTLDALWANVTAKPGGPEVEYPQDPRFLRPENLLDAFVHAEDTLPRGRSMVVNRKFLHPRGCVGRVTYQAHPSRPCRGILGATSHGIIRLSNGNITDQGGIAPGVGLKFPRTGLSSADMVFGPDGFNEEDADSAFVTRAQRTWLGQIPSNPAYRDIRTLFWIFDRVREQGRYGGPAENEQGLPRACPMGFAGRAVSVQPLLTHTQDGASAPLLPDRPDPIGLEMLPTRHFFEQWQTATGHRYLDVLPQIAPGPIYDVVAHFGPGRSQPIGTVHLAEQFVTSAFGDARLFFRHPPECPSAGLAPLMREQ